MVVTVVSPVFALLIVGRATTGLWIASRKGRAGQGLSQYWFFLAGKRDGAGDLSGGPGADKFYWAFATMECHMLLGAAPVGVWGWWVISLVVSMELCCSLDD